MVNCVHPAAVNGRLGTCQRVVDLIIGALAQAVPERVHRRRQRRLHVDHLRRASAGRQRVSGSIWKRSAAAPARAPTKDGLDGVHVHMTNTSNLPVEALEIEYPLTLLRYELVDGSGGAGPASRRHGVAPGVSRRGASAACGWTARACCPRRGGWSAGMPGGKADVVLRGGAAPFDHGSGALRARRDHRGRHRRLRRLWPARGTRRRGGAPGCGSGAEQRRGLEAPHGGKRYSAASRARSAINCRVSGSRLRPYSIASSSGSKPRIRNVVTPRS